MEKAVRKYALPFHLLKAYSGLSSGLRSSPLTRFEQQA